jgi:hypothetical protein
MVAKLTAVMRRIAPKVWLWPLHVTHGTLQTFATVPSTVTI